MAPNKIIVLFLCLIPLYANAQFGLGKKRTERTNILNTPTVGDYTLHDPEYRSSVKLMDGYPDEKSAWIVYSDRDNNTTFQNPGNEKQTLASLNFMQACFVIGEKDDYVELAEYVPRVNISKGKKTLENPKYLGWVNKNTLLLWNRALKDKGTNYYLKTITAFGTQRIFDILQHHVAGDSIITFANPFLNKPVAKCGMGNIFYIYKESVLGNEYLVGPDPNFLPENSAQSDMGWVSKDLIRVWGTKGFVSLNPDLEAALPLYQSYPGIKNNSVDQAPVTIARSPYTTPKSDLEKLYPIVKYSTTKDGDVLISSSFLEDVLDKDKNRVYNISGDLISNEDIETFSAKSSKLNIVLVVSSGRKNGQYINNLQGVLETDAWQEAARNNFKEVNIGAVVYKDYGPNCDNAITPLTNDYRAIDEFLQEQRKVENDGCDDNRYYQGMYGGIIKATKMLQDHGNESNIILVYGSGSDETNRKGEAIRSIQNARARLLFFQTHNIPNEPAYINFVGDAKELISKSAENITELKKKIIVPNTYPNILNSVSFVNDSTGRIQQLDYPKKSITQGLLLFPHDSENMPAKYLADYLDSLITSIATDNRTIERGLRSAMAQSSSGNTKIKKEFAYRFPKYLNERIPLDFLKSNTLRDQNFLIPAWMVLQSKDTLPQAGLTAGVLLSEKEYTDFANQLALLGGNGYYDSKELIVNRIADAVEKAQSLQNTKLDKPVKELTFSEALGFVSGYFPVDPIWRSTTLAEYQSSGKIGMDIGKVFLDECRSKAVWLHDHNNNSNLQIRNNSRTYYVINETHLPVNTVVSSLPRKGTAVTAPTVPDKTREKGPDKNRTGDIGSVISDYNNNPVQTQIPNTTSRKSAEDVIKTKTAGKKEKNAGTSPGQDAPAAAKTDNKREGSNINSINEDLNTAPPPAGANTAKKEKNDKNDINKTDTVNYRRRIAARETQEGEKIEQPKKNNADFERDLKQLEQSNATSATGTHASDKPVSAPKATKKTLPKKNADFEKDLMELQGNATQKNAVHKEPATTSKVSIKKDNRNTHTMEEDLDKIPARNGDSKTKKESTTATDTVNYRNQISKQKTTEK